MVLPLPNHRKTLALASLLDVNPEPLVGHLVCLWLWSLDNAPDGEIQASPRIIAKVAGWRGDHDAFVEALETAGFVERVDDIKYIIHNWDDYAGKLVERRKANAERMRAARANRPSIEEPARSAHVQRTERARVGLPDPTGPDHTGPLEAKASSTAESAEIAADATKTTTKPPPVPLLTLSEDATAVLEFWRQAHGKRSLPKLNPTQATQLETAVVDLGFARLTEAVTYMAARGVPELSKAISAAKTKRQQDEQGIPARPNGYHANDPPSESMAEHLRMAKLIVAKTQRDYGLAPREGTDAEN